MKKGIGAEVKKLTNQIKKLNSKINNVQANVNVEVTELKEMRGRRKAYEDRLTYINDDDLTISDHAILRYLQRVLNINVAEYKETILKDVNGIYTKLECDSKIPVTDEHGKYSAIIRNGNIVSILTKENNS